MSNRRLYHHGILGMHWGVRRENPSGIKRISEHDEVEALKKKRLSSLTNQEVKKMIGRENAVREYRKTPIMKGGKNLRDLTTDQIRVETNRNKLRQQLLLEKLDPRNLLSGYGYTKVKDIDHLSSKEINKYLERLTLTKSYKDLKSGDIETGKWLMNHILTGKPFEKYETPPAYKEAWPYGKPDRKPESASKGKKKHGKKH